MHEFGEQVGRRAAAKLAHLSLDRMLDELASVWQAYRIGTLTIESREPLVIQISNCTVCGQLEGTGGMFECAFHEEFFQGRPERPSWKAGEGEPGDELRRGRRHLVQAPGR